MQYKTWRWLIWDNAPKSLFGRKGANCSQWQIYAAPRGTIPSTSASFSQAAQPRLLWHLDTLSFGVTALCLFSEIFSLSPSPIFLVPLATQLEILLESQHCHDFPPSQFASVLLRALMRLCDKLENYVLISVSLLKHDVLPACKHGITCSCIWARS